MFVKSAVAVALCATFATAATNTTTVEPSTVSATIRSQWCAGQQNTCPILCANQYMDNVCDPNTLNYTCTCNNGTAPGLEFYTQTMPTYECLEVYSNCITAGQNDATAQRLCTEARDANCGTLDPTKFVAPTSTSSASGTPTVSAGAASSNSAATSTSKAAAATMAIVADYGTGLFAAGAAAAFGYML
ncbi:hypothetical protein BJ875DRAFT_30630 [Amylocarpus encephaloides]|uniref:DUF7707 domain-containing protein n=1 Tax=Amylocarpus encephaloides TaxID=45428 RepID=A0A9P7YHY2_9HELO|nr:hypothetical protein BJ875DRAFT_30630 [Amylocarpus encephaloides]